MTQVIHWVGRNLIPKSLQPAVRRNHYRRLIHSLAPEPEAVTAAKYIRPGDTVLDLGANIGRYTKTLSAYVGEKGMVHALEPVPETFDYLHSDIRSLGLSNVICYNIASSDKTGMAKMNIPQWSSGGSNIYESSISQDGIPVRTMRLDDLFPDLSPSFIKCDVEGHEIETINGALKLIQRCRPTWLMEVTHPEVTPLMESLGYDMVPATESNSFYVARR